MRGGIYPEDNLAAVFVELKKKVAQSVSQSGAARACATESFLQRQRAWHACRVEKRGRRGCDCDVFIGTRGFEQLNNLYFLANIMHIWRFCRQIPRTLLILLAAMTQSRKIGSFCGEEVPRYSFLQLFHNRRNFGHFEASLENNNNKRQERKEGSQTERGGRQSGGEEKINVGNLPSKT